LADKHKRHYGYVKHILQKYRVKLRNMNCWLLCSLQLNFGHVQKENTVSEYELPKKSA